MVDCKKSEVESATFDGSKKREQLTSLNLMQGSIRGLASPQGDKQTTLMERNVSCTDKASRPVMLPPNFLITQAALCSCSASVIVEGSTGESADMGRRWEVSEMVSKNGPKGLSAWPPYLQRSVPGDRCQINLHQNK